MEVQMKRGCDHRCCYHNLSNCKLSPAKDFLASTAFEPVACITTTEQSYEAPYSYIGADQFILSCERK